MYMCIHISLPPYLYSIYLHLKPLYKYIYIYMYPSTSTSVYLSLFVYLYIYICMFMCVYIYTYTITGFGVGDPRLAPFVDLTKDIATAVARTRTMIPTCRAEAINKDESTNK